MNANRYAALAEVNEESNHAKTVQTKISNQTKEDYAKGRWKGTSARTVHEDFKSAHVHVVGGLLKP